MDESNDGHDDVIIEFHRVGNAVKVSAIDTRTFLEVSIMAPPNCSEREMTATVIRKLNYVRARQAAKPGTRK